jgi:hypothetical protein
VIKCRPLSSAWNAAASSHLGGATPNRSNCAGMWNGRAWTGTSATPRMEDPEYVSRVDRTAST